MKFKLLYTAIAAAALSFTACSDDPMDATSKHVYGPDESPYVRADEKAVTDCSVKFRVGTVEAQTINLKDYAELIQRNLKMTVDDMLAALETGAVKFCTINPALNAWSRVAPNKGTGWYFNSAGGVCESSSAVASIELDKANMRLVIDAPEDVQAGSPMSVSVGFVIDNGKNFDDYVRFRFTIAAVDLGSIYATVSIPDGDYASEGVFFRDYTEQIESCIGISIDEFVSNCADPEGPLAMYMVDEAGNWDTESNYTANGIGYWLNASGKVCTWGSDGFTLFAEASSDDGALWIGRAPGISSGTSLNIHTVYVLKADPTKYVDLYITATCE